MAGGPHAEVEAIQNAELHGHATRGATIVARVVVDDEGLAPSPDVAWLGRWVNRSAENDAALPAEADPVSGGEDDSLTLMFMCCHPILKRRVRVALTLKAVCGFSTAEIARAFFAHADTPEALVSRGRFEPEVNP